MGDWTGPAYEAVELLGYGPASEVWRGRVRATGERVVLRRLTPPDPGLAERAREVVRAPHVLRLREVRDDLLVVEHAPGGSLEALLARRGVLRPGEVVTALAPVAQALVSARHGALRASSVLLDASGRPLLELPGEGHGDDVKAVGELAFRCLAGTAAELPPVPLPLADAVARARAGEVEMAELADLLLTACPAVPLEVGVVAAPEPRRRAVAPAAVVVAVLVAVVAAGWGWGRRTGAGTATELPTPTAGPPDWAEVVRDLDLARATAFARGDARLLDAVWAPGAAQLAEDRQLLARVGRAPGAAHEVAAVSAGFVTGVRAVLDVKERLAGGPWAVHTMVLTRNAQGWRVERVSG